MQNKFAPFFKERTFLIVIFLATILVYVSALLGPFQFDDYGVIVDYSGIHSWNSYSKIMLHSLRPILKLTYTFNWTLGQGNPFGFHVFNIIIHLINIFIVGLISEFGINQNLKKISFNFNESSLVAMFLFGIHPIQTEAVTYICGRSSSLLTLFYCSSFFTYIIGQRNNYKFLRSFVSPFLFICAVATKEVGLTLPLAILLWDRYIEKLDFWKSIKRQFLFFILVIILMIIAIANTSYFNLLYNLTGVRPFLDALLYQVDGVNYLFYRIFVFNKLSIFPGLGAHLPSAFEIVLESLIILFVLVLAFINRHKNTLICWGIFWFYLHLFFPYVFLPRLEVLNEHHSYLANVGLFIALGILLKKIQATIPLNFKKIEKVSLIFLIFTMLTSTIYRNLEYRSEITLWEATKRSSPPHAKIYNNLGVAYKLAGRFNEARIEFQEALKLAPEYPDAIYNLNNLPK